MRKIICLLTVLLVPFPAMQAGSSTVAHSGARLSDAEIEGVIRAKLTKSKIGKDGFTVHVKNGIATWQGTTGVMQHKGAATRMAKTAGAIQVVNNIKISDAALAKARGNLSGSPQSGSPQKVQVKNN